MSEIKYPTDQITDLPEPKWKNLLVQQHCDRERFIAEFQKTLGRPSAVMTRTPPFTVVHRAEPTRIGTVVKVDRLIGRTFVDVLWSDGDLRFLPMEDVIETSPLALLAAQSRSYEDELIRQLTEERARYRELLVMARECLRDHLKAAYYKNETYMREVFLRLDMALTHDPEGRSDEEVSRTAGQEDDQGTAQAEEV